MEKEPQEGRAVRIRDVANEAGVSVATVSYVLNQKGNISNDTRERVLAAAQQLHYKPNIVSRTLASGKSRSIGLVTPRGRGVNDPFYSLVVAGITQEVAQLGYHVVLIPGESPTSTLMTEIRSLMVSGVFLLEVEKDDERISLFRREKIPLTLLGSCNDAIDWVEVDNYRGGWMATTHLLELGHRRIAYLGPATDDRVGADRRRGYEDCLRSWDRDLMPLCMEAPFTLDGGYQAGRRLLSMNPRPTAVFLAGDLMAEGLYQAAAELDVRIPSELSVVGFDDIPMASQLTVPLTTVSQNAVSLGRRMARQLVNQLDRDRVVQNTVLPELVVRQSTGQVPLAKVRPLTGAHIVLKRGHCFSLWSPSGMMDPREGNHGVFFQDTRWLNVYHVHIDGESLEAATTTVTDTGFQMRYVVLPQTGILEITRTVFLTETSLRDEWHWRHYGERCSWQLDLQVSPDFRDIFELRGFQVQSKGTRRSELLEDGSEHHHYLGKDGLARELDISLTPYPDENELGFKSWRFANGEQEGTLVMHLSWRVPRGTPARDDEGGAIHDWPTATLANPRWQAALDRARADLQMLRTDFGFGPVLAAGLPWFGTLFGRDAVISAMQTLVLDPTVAESTLATLAHFQGKVMNDARAEMPGKIVHEVRFGELANTGAVPFGRYYGSVDVTPLFITLLEATWRRTGRFELLTRHLDAAEAALGWIEAMARAHSSGLLIFDDSDKTGLVVQSWKDSSDSMVYVDGRQAQAPLAVAEVQGYLFQAYLAMASILTAVGQMERAETLRKQARSLRIRFHEQFWMDDRRYYAMATDATGQRLSVLSSDAGHCLWTGIIPERFSSDVVRTLLGNELFSGWGIRTLGSGEVAFDPYSYHRGSVWPHDTSLIGAGMARYGYMEEATILTCALLDAASAFPQARIPELFSGAARSHSPSKPLPYPMACAPQAWAAGALWILLISVLQVSIDGCQKTLQVGPCPEELCPITIRGLPIEGSRVDIEWTPDSIHVIGLPVTWQWHRA